MMVYNVSGVNCKGIPLNIIYNTVGGGDTLYYQNGKTKY